MAKDDKDIKRVLILKATDTIAVRAEAAVHVGIAAVEVQGAGVDAANRAAPVVALTACGVDRAIAATAVARNNKLQG